MRIAGLGYNGSRPPNREEEESILARETRYFEELNQAAETLRSRSREISERAGQLNEHFRPSRLAREDASLRSGGSSTASLSELNQTQVQNQSDNRNAVEGDLDLEAMRPFIERLASRDDIPEEWWASAGLGRLIANQSRAARERL